MAEFGRARLTVKCAATNQPWNPESQNDKTRRRKKKVVLCDTLAAANKGADAVGENRISNRVREASLPACTSSIGASS